MDDTNNLFKDASLVELAKYGLLNSILQERLISALIASEVVDPDLLDTLFKEFCKSAHIFSATDLSNYLRVHALTEESLLYFVLRDQRITQFAVRAFRQKAEEAFLDNKTSLDSVIYSLIRVSDRGLSLEIYLRLLEGDARFEDMASRFDEGPQGATKGLVGPVPLNQAHPQLVDRLRSAKVGEVNVPFKLDKWWLIFRLESFTPARLDTNTTVELCKRLFHEDIQHKLENLKSRLSPVE